MNSGRGATHTRKTKPAPMKRISFDLGFIEQLIIGFLSKDKV